MRQSHRKDSCKTCYYFAEVFSYNQGLGEAGRCERFPPSGEPDMIGGTATTFPILVDTFRWCGEYEPKDD